jgi:hypothetical protein
MGSLCSEQWLPSYGSQKFAVHRDKINAESATANSSANSNKFFALSEPLVSCVSLQQRQSLIIGYILESELVH